MPTDASFRPDLPSTNAEVMTPTTVIPQRRALAAPSIRKLAQELGVDVNAVEGTGTGGRVILEDVNAHVPRVGEVAQQSAHPQAGASPLPDFSQWGAVERIRLQHMGAKRTTLASQRVPHFTQHAQADLSEFEAIRWTAQCASPDLPLTITAFTLAVTAAALKKFPQFNASLDEARKEVILKRYINIGVAVDTPLGLTVPVITAADRKSVRTLAYEIANLTSKIRSNILTNKNLYRIYFTITNLGECGGTAFIPAVNFPEVSILGLSRSAIAPTYVNGVCKPRPLLPLSLSYDPQLINDVDGIRFLRWLTLRLEHPLLLEL